MGAVVKDLSIVLPCFNEQESIPVMIPRLTNALEAMKRQNQVQNYEIIVVNDSSTDQSLSLLESFTQVRVVQNEGPRGYGRALKRGFSKATGDWICFLDMDNTYRPEDLPLFLSEISQSDSDFIIGTRALSEKGMSFVRGLGNWAYMSLASIIYGSKLRDVCSGYRVFHRRHLDEILTIPEEGLDFSIHLTLKMITKNVTIHQIAIGYDERLGESKLSVLSDGWAFLMVILNLKLRRLRALKHSRVR